ncbi:MAG: hypothetical protein M3405_06520 [Acidobacteriota bacterium]|nr:hypothetical protein [Acidobacteriota bacterium]
MINYSLFINGVHSEVLEDIFEVQKHLPEQVLYLQPYSGKRIVKLADNNPSTEHPVQLFLSLTNDLSNIHFTCQIIGWDDKHTLSGRKKEIIRDIIMKFQPTEDDGIYLQAREGGSECRNLLHVRRMQKLSKPFSVSELIKISDNSPISTNRTTAGGWSYVKVPDQKSLQQKV